MTRGHDDGGFSGTLHDAFEERHALKTKTASRHGSCPCPHARSANDATRCDVARERDGGLCHAGVIQYY